MARTRKTYGHSQLIPSDEITLYELFTGSGKLDMGTPSLLEIISNPKEVLFDHIVDMWRSGSYKPFTPNPETLECINTGLIADAIGLAHFVPATVIFATLVSSPVPAIASAMICAHTFMHIGRLQEKKSHLLANSMFASYENEKRSKIENINDADNVRRFGY